MLTVYTTSDVPAYLDAKAVRLLAEGRANFARFGLGSDPVLEWGADTLIFPWRGGRVMSTLAVALTAAGANAALDGVCLTMTASSRAAAVDRLQSLADSAPDPLALAASVKNKIVEKYDEFLGGELLSIAYAARSLDVDGAWHALASLLNQIASQTSSSPIAGD
jgi:ATP-dependent Lhr-like helicase